LPQKYSMSSVLFHVVRLIRWQVCDIQGYILLKYPFLLRLEVYKVDRSVIQGLLKMPISRKSLAERL